mmetsp:Transcript_36527/g.83942  ORF Transcript_36527/g.83942 Transcript_36527/m.83942 type:complete len:108 (+) Transcript_36527:57-380(+)
MSNFGQASPASRSVSFGATEEIKFHVDIAEESGASNEVAMRLDAGEGKDCKAEEEETEVLAATLEKADSRRQSRSLSAMCSQGLSGAMSFDLSRSRLKARRELFASN